MAETSVGREGREEVLLSPHMGYAEEAADNVKSIQFSKQYQVFTCNLW